MVIIVNNRIKNIYTNANFIEIESLKSFLKKLKLFYKTALSQVVRLGLLLHAVKSLAIFCCSHNCRSLFRRYFGLGSCFALTRRTTQNPQKKPLTSEWVVFCILMVSFSVYYLGVYMFLGLMNLFIFSVSTTLKSYLIIIAYIFFYVNKFIQYLLLNSRNQAIVYILHFTKLNTFSLYCYILISASWEK